MKKAILALIAACTACCAGLLTIPAVVAGGSVFGLTAWAGKFSLEALLCWAPLALIALYVAYRLIRARRQAKKACESGGACGCK